MKGFALFTLAPLAIVGIEVNFFFDTTCQSFAGSADVGLDQVVGGPFGSQSMEFVANDVQSCSQTCGPNLIFCKNAACNAWDKAPSTNSCKHFANGVWASQVCGCLSCSNECSGIPE